MGIFINGGWQLRENSGGEENKKDDFCRQTDHPAEMTKMKVAIVGCGHIAQVHIPNIRRISRATVVAICDRDEPRASYVAAQYQVGKYYTDLQAMLEEARPDVVHILTPPQTHAALAT